MKPAYRNLIAPMICAIIGLVVVCLFFFGTLRIFKTPTGGMSPTVVPGDYVFATKTSSSEGQLKQNDIVIFSPPTDTKSRYIQRIAALSGDRIEMKDGHLTVNGEPLVSPAGLKSSPAKQDQLGLSGISPPSYPLVVSPGQLFVLGDNYENSLDSRYFGPIEITSITHLPKYIILPFNRIGSVAPGDGDEK